jgi:lipopolysaccharide/colanic/teichoic acid biosynthesis glycosyltransferase
VTTVALDVFDEHTLARPRALPLSLLRRLVVSSPQAAKMLESVAVAVLAVVVLDGALAFLAAGVLVLRALRTPIPRLGVHPLHGIQTGAVDYVAAFGVAALWWGPTATEQSGRWAAVTAAGLAADVVVEALRWVARRRIPSARVRLMVTGDGAEGLVDVLGRHRGLGVDAFCVGDPSVSGRRLDAMVASVEADAVLVSGVQIDPDVRAALDELSVPIFALAGQARSWASGGRGPVETLWSQRIVALPPAPTHRPSWVLRAVVERLIALVALVLSAPLLGALALAVRCTSPGPVLFRQTRVGMGGREFTILKFRSMPVHHTASTWNAAYDEQPTSIGRIMRRLNLDELPQLLNVVRGDMSLVGPRPELPRFVDLFEDTVEGYTLRHRVPGGMTGWAQVHGLRGDTSLVDRVAFDNNYVDDWSIGRDCSILLRTVAQFLPARFRPAPPEDVIDLVDQTGDAVRASSGAARTS